MHEPEAHELRAAIAAVTRALATVGSTEEVFELVRERAVLRDELRVLDDNARDHERQRVA